MSRFKAEWFEFILFLFSFRAKLFRGKKVQGEYDIRVEQVKSFITITDGQDETIKQDIAHYQTSYWTFQRRSRMNLSVLGTFFSPLTVHNAVKHKLNCVEAG